MVYIQLCHSCECFASLASLVFCVHCHIGPVRPASEAEGNVQGQVIPTQRLFKSVLAAHTLLEPVHFMLF